MPSSGKTESSMAQLVSADKKTVVSEGVVKQDAEQSISTLGEKQSAIKKATSVKIASDQGRTKASRRAQDSQGAEKGLGTDVPGAGAEEKAPLKARRILASQAAYELDKSDELEGTADIYEIANAANRAIERHRSKDRGAASKANKGGAASSKKKASAQGANKKDASPAKAAQPQKATTAVGSQGAKATTAAATETKTAIGAIGGSGAAALGGVICAVVAFILCALVIGQIVSALFGFWQNEADKTSLEGLPPYITYEMVEEALACQEEYGHPAGCTIAQIIVESGQGDHLSGLATQDHNLFGMKWSSSYALCEEVAGKSSWRTGEEYGGEQVTITADFISFVGDAECIRFRSRVFLQADRYASNALIREAIANHDSDKMAEGLKDAGWATSSSYVESLKSTMETYNLYRFDGMSLEDFRSGAVLADAIVSAAYSQLGVPYVWGGTTPGVGLDCSGLTQYCYKQAGISIPRNTEAQYAQGKKIALSEAQPGDILYRMGHVGIYIGGDRYIHAPHRGEVVKIASGISSFTCALSYR